MLLKSMSPPEFTVMVPEVAVISPELLLAMFPDPPLLLRFTLMAVTAFKLTPPPAVTLSAPSGVLLPTSPVNVAEPAVPPLTVRFCAPSTVLPKVTVPPPLLTVSAEPSETAPARSMAPPCDASVTALLLPRMMLSPLPGVSVMPALFVVIVPGELKVMLPPVEVMAMLLPLESDMLSPCRSMVTLPEAARMILEVADSRSRYVSAKTE